MGQWAEHCAQSYLLDQGLQLLAANYHSRYGEIDLIMLDQECICFIEVKARRYGSQVDGFSAVTKKKQQKIIVTAQIYLEQYAQFVTFTARFDVLVVEFSKALDLNLGWRALLQQNRLNLQWLKHAYRL